MSTFCTIMSVLGLNLTSCAPPPLPLNIPDSDVDAFTHVAPAPPAPVIPPPAPVETIREVVRVETVYVQAEPPPPPPVVEEPPEEVPVAEAVDTTLDRHAEYGGWAYASRRRGRLGQGDDQDGWSVTFDSASVAGPSGVQRELTALPPDPLALPRDLSGLAARDKAASFTAPGIQSGLPVDNARILTADRYITAILESSINTQIGSGGRVVIQTSTNVFGYHGRSILLPKGTRIICTYGADGEIGATRVSMTCQRVLTAGVRAEIYEVSASVGDAQGRAGVTGDVDNRFWQKYGTAFIIAGLSAAVQGATAAVDGDATSTAEAIGDAAATEIATRFGEITAQVLQEAIPLQPVLTIPQGTRVQIQPLNDWYIARPL